MPQYANKSVAKTSFNRATEAEADAEEEEEEEEEEEAAVEEENDEEIVA